MADLHSVVQPEATSALQALSTATILCVPHDAVRRTAVAHPALAEALWRDCMVDASILAQWVVNVGRRDARARIAHVLCEVALRVGAAPAKGEIIFPFPVTQTQLADVTGLTAVHVNRTLQGLRAEGLADVKGNARPGIVRGPGITEFTFRAVEDLEIDEDGNPTVETITILVSGPNGSIEIVLGSEGIAGQAVGSGDVMVEPVGPSTSRVTFIE